jgi:predicted DNA repair protein MutK
MGCQIGILLIKWMAPKTFGFQSMGMMAMLFAGDGANMFGIATIPHATFVMYFMLRRYWTNK